ncbi:MAG: fructose 1,6-bisphosphatase, partial [Chloroflexi bacterium]|nr:fructose 1,6-bisphosphatase [Chloroflexota bacterium]
MRKHYGEVSTVITLSVIKADIGGFVGHSSIHPDLIATAQEQLEKAKSRGLLIDHCVSRVGDDLELIMTHTRGDANPDVHRLAWDTFKAATKVAQKLKLYGAGQDLLVDSFAGNVKGLGPGVAEMTIDERKSEPVVIFMADKTSAGAWNLPLYKTFADPFNTAGLVIGADLHGGFRFEVHDVVGNLRIFFDAPEEIYDLLAFIGAPGRYVVKAVYHRETGAIAASSSTDKLSLIAGKYVGKDDPVCIVRSQGIFPAVGEVLEPYTMPQIVAGWMRGSHHGPLMPVSFASSNCARFDGPPRVVAAGFQIANGRLIGPRDMFDDPAYDEVRHQCIVVASILRQHGAFEPHRLSLDVMEYTTMPKLM